MKKLFLIDGAMRPAKNELVKCLEEFESVLSGDKESSYVLARKVSTKVDEVDQDYIHQENLREDVSNSKKEYISYEYENNLYAIKKSDLDDYIFNHENTFLIVRSTLLISELKEKYTNNDKLFVKVISVYIYSDKKTIESYYNNSKDDSGITLKERQKRLKKADEDFENAIAGNEIYDEIIIYSKENGTGNSSLSNKIKSLVNKYNSSFEPYSFFFIHSYKDKNAKKLYNALKKVTEERFKNSNINSLSLINGKWSYAIDLTVFEHIEKSDIIICDITKANISPNVWLELGYAFSVIRSRKIKIGARLIIIAKEKDFKKIRKASDISNYNVIFYKDINDFISKIDNHINIIVNGDSSDN